MNFNLKTDFDSVDAAIAYIKGDVATEINRLEGVETELSGEKQKLIGKRDQLLDEVKSAKAKAKKFEDYENVDIDALIQFKETHSGDENEIEKRYQAAYDSDKKKFEARIAAIEEERAEEKKRAESERAERQKAQLRAEVISECSKSKHGVINPEQFYSLFGTGKIQRDDDTGELFAEVDYKRLNVSDYISHLKEISENQHHFRASGHTGSSSRQGLANDGKQKPWKDMSLTEKTAMMKNNPDGAKKHAAASGVSL